MLTFELSNNLPGVNFELYGSLDQTRVVLDHFLMPFEHKMLLDKITNIVQSRGTYIPTGTLQRVCQVLHFLIISLFKRLYDFLHGGIKRHALEIAQHHVEDLWLTSKALNGQVNIYGGRSVHFEDLDLL